jgi:FAD:protein FMN transferase
VPTKLRINFIWVAMNAAKRSPAVPLAVLLVLGWNSAPGHPEMRGRVEASESAELAPDAVSERAELVMGTVAGVALFDPAASPATFELAFAALRAVDASMTLYEPTSELRRVNERAAERAVPVSAELFVLLTRARDLSALTDGAFDVTVLPLLRAWGAYPHLGALRGEPVAVGFAGLQLDPVGRAVRFQRRGMGIDLGAVAKGFALDRARAALVTAQVTRARLDLGGELAFIGMPPDGWRIAVRDPSAPNEPLGILTLDGDLAVSTSGNYMRDFAAEGWRIPRHVYDPRTYRAVESRRAVTVWAPDATTADALSTGFLVLGPEGARAALARFPGVGALYVDGAGTSGTITFLGCPPREWMVAGGRQGIPGAPMARGQFRTVAGGDA